MTKRQPQSFSDFSTIKENEQDYFVEEEINALNALDDYQDEKITTKFSFGKIFISAFIALLFLGFSIWVYDLINHLFNQYFLLGYLGFALALIALLALLAFVLMEIRAILRLGHIEHMRKDAAYAVEFDDMKKARASIDDLIRFTAKTPHSFAGRNAMQSHQDDIIDGVGLIHLAEYEILRPVDIEARKIILNTAKRVSIVTALSPRAFIDLGYVLYESIKLIRKLAELYGARPAKLGYFSLLRKVMAHLAVTGSMAVGDGLVQHIIGQGLATKLSARLGEGVVNGLMTVRIGIAAMDILRPFPFLGQKRPTIGDFTSDLIGMNKEKSTIKTKNADN